MWVRSGQLDLLSGPREIIWEMGRRCCARSRGKKYKKGRQEGNFLPLPQFSAASRTVGCPAFVQLAAGQFFEHNIQTPKVLAGAQALDVPV